MSTLKVATIQTTNGVEVYTQKAWANFYGTQTTGLRGSGNVSSLTDLATGRYSLALTNAISTSSYSAQTSWKNDTLAAPSQAEFDQCCWVWGNTTTTVLVFAGYRSDVGNGYTDNEFQYVSVTA